MRFDVLDQTRRSHAPMSNGGKGGKGKRTSATHLGQRWRNVCALVAVTVTASPACAQFEKATQVLNTLQGWLLSIGAIVVTIAIMFVGFRMMFQAAQWKDVAPVFWGGILVGGGSALAALFF